MRGRRSSEAGLTLIELLVTITLASAVAASTFVFFASQQRVYETQAQLLTVQQNLWLAMETLSRQVRSAGSAMTGCGAQGLRATNGGGPMFRLAPMTITNGAAGAPDQLTLTYFSGGSGNFWDGALAATVPTTFSDSFISTPNSNLFREGEIILLLNTTTAPPGGDRGCSMFQISGPPGVGTLPVSSSSPWNAPGNTPGLIPYNYDPGTSGIRNMGTLTSVRLFIDPGSATQAPRLMIDDLADGAAAQTLAEGIEDLQIAYACDMIPAAAPDGALTEGTTVAGRLADEWVNNQTGDVAPAACVVPTAIRITLVGRSLAADTALTATAGSGTGTNSFKPAAEDGVAGAPDNFRHRLLTTTIFPRNDNQL
jgi:type II secretory pathway pseudopilin PulG